MPRLLPPFLRGLSYRNQPHWLYFYLSRNIHWGQTPKKLANKSLTISIITGILAIVLGLVGWSSRSEIVLWLVLGFGAFSFILVDIASIAFAILGVRSEKERFDLLSITHIDPADFVNVQHQLAQVRTWRMLVVMQAVRSIAVVFVLTFGIVVLVFSVLMTFGGEILWIISLLVMLALAEPIWRLQMMTAFGVMVASFQRDTIITWASGLGLMFCVWIAHGILGVIPFLILRMNDEHMLIMMTVALPVITGIIWYGQRRLRNMCLNIAVEHIFKPT